MDDSYDLTQEIDIDASPELVFRFFTDAELLRRWLCRHAELDPRPGGAFTLNVTGTHITRGEFRELEPGRRLVFTWLFDHVQPPIPTTVEVTLTPVGRGTHVRLRHYGLAHRTLRDRHAGGWEHYLPRLAAAASGADPGPDAWRTDGAGDSVK